MTFSVTADPDRFDEAADWFSKRTVLTQTEALELGADAGRRAFWIGGGLQLSQIQRVFDQIQKAEAKGEPFEDWRKRVKDELRDDAHAETVFRNAVQRSYNAGRWAQMTEPSVVKFRPYWMYDSVLDSRTCFAAGTMVSIPGGRTTPIETLKPGHIVLSSRGRPRRVIATQATPKCTWGTIKLSDGTRLRVTPNHPLLTRHGWIKAGRLEVGDELLRQQPGLQDLWEGLSSASSELQVLQPRVPEGLHARETLQDLRGSILPAGKGRNQALLQFSVQGKSTPAPLRRVQQPVSANRRDKGLLLASLPRHDGDLRMVQGLIHGPKALYGTRSVSFLLSQLQDDAFSGRAAVVGNVSHLCSLPEGIQVQATGERHLLLESVPAQRAQCLSALREALSAHYGSILLGELLPKVDGRDQYRDTRSSGTRSASGALRCGSKDRPMVGGLPGRRESRSRVRRRLLAQEIGGERLSKRPRVASARLHGDSATRVTDQERAWSSDPRVEQLWPAPSDKIRIALATSITRIDWELTAEPELAYDIQVQDDAGFIAEGVVVHNSEICKICNKVVLPAEHSWFYSHWPPQHHRCRAGVRNLRRSEAEKRGISNVPPALDPSPGFGRAPIDDPVWKPDPKKHDTDLTNELGRKETATAQKVKKPKKAPQHHDPLYWEDRYRLNEGEHARDYAEAAPAVGWGRAMLERGLDRPFGEVIAELARLKQARFPALEFIDLDEIASGLPLEQPIRSRLLSLSKEWRGLVAIQEHTRTIKAGAFPIDSTDEAAQQARTWYELMLDASVKRPSHWKYRTGARRAYATNRRYVDKTLGLIDANSVVFRFGTEHHTVVHEFAHALEFENKKALERSVAFLGARTRGEPLEKLRNIAPERGGGPDYEDDEEARPDKFGNAYIGKDYGGIATEVTSMGYQALAIPGRSTLRSLSEHDPDMLFFLLGQLAGR